MCILFAFYCICLTALPCRDACDSHKHNTPITIEQANNHHQQEHDQCSPFCYCACCSSVAIVTQYVNFCFKESFSAGVNLTAPDDNLPDRCYAIWQPPKLS